MAGFWKTLFAWTAGEEPKPVPKLTIPEWTIGGKAFYLEHEYGQRFEDMVHARAKEYAAERGSICVSIGDVRLAGDELMARLSE